MAQERVTIDNIDYELRRIRTPNKVELHTIAEDRDQINHTFAHLKAIAEYFGTDDISTDSWLRSRGCDTCGYGREYASVIHVSNATRGV